MTSLTLLSPPASFLILCLNAAVASLVACGIAVALSRRAAWSLPARHALLAAALAASLTAPLFAPMVHAPSLWAIHVAATVDEPSPAVINQSSEAVRRDERAAPPIAAAIPVAGARLDRPIIAGPTSAALGSPVPESTPPAPIHGRQTLSTTPWARIVGALLCGIWFAGIAVGLARTTVGLTRLSRWMQTVAVADSPSLAAAAR